MKNCGHSPFSRGLKRLWGVSGACRMVSPDLLKSEFSSRRYFHFTFFAAASTPASIASRSLRTNKRPFAITALIFLVL